MKINNLTNPVANNLKTIGGMFLFKPNTLNAVKLWHFLDECVNARYENPQYFNSRFGSNMKQNEQNVAREDLTCVVSLKLARNISSEFRIK